MLCTVIYRKDNGKIAQVTRTSQSVEEAVAGFNPKYYGALTHDRYVDPDLHYVEGDNLMPKKPFPGVKAQDLPDGKIKVNLPSGTYVLWPDGFEEQIQSGSISFDCNVKTTLNFTFRHPKYHRKDWEINV